MEITDSQRWDFLEKHFICMGGLKGRRYVSLAFKNSDYIGRAKAYKETLDAAIMAMQKGKENPNVH